MCMPLLQPACQPFAARTSANCSARKLVLRGSAGAVLEVCSSWRRQPGHVDDLPPQSRCFATCCSCSQMKDFTTAQKNSMPNFTLVGANTDTGTVVVRNLGQLLHLTQLVPLATCGTSVHVREA